MTTATPETTAPPLAPPLMTTGGLPLPDPKAPPAPRKLRPLHPASHPFGARTHLVSDFAVTVPADTLREDLLDGEFWVNVIARVPLLSEIRVVWEDGSQYARLIVTHSQGRFSRLKCLEFHKLDEVLVVTEEEHAIQVKNRGPMKWCLEDAKTGEKLKTMIPTQIEALKERDDLYRARGR